MYLRTRTVLAALLAISAFGIYAGPANAQADSRYFPETRQSVHGLFLRYWYQHGGLAQQGYPLTAESREASPTDGKTYTVQYFEGAVFELHPENNPSNQVILSLLGSREYARRYPNGAPGQR